MTKVVIVGGGLVGALNACYFAKRGYQVELYEMRSDIRLQEVVKGRSINLALSRRGRDALNAVGLEDDVTTNGIPMYSRMIHDLDGTKRSIPYGRPDQYIMSIDRRRLNELLLDAAEKYPNVQAFFEHKFVRCDLETGECIFQKNGSGGDVTVTSDLIVGTDGAYSTVRRQIMKNTLLDYSQEYIPHGYMELCIPATEDGRFAMETNNLHIWARNTFMLIALPNVEDNSFVLTLFMPFDIYNSIKTERDLMKFFQEQFPDSIPLIGKKELIETYFSSKPLPLVSIKCSPYHVKNRVVIMGDAAHAMVPFYGQGMNCGFEDCIVFHEILEKNNDDLEKALAEYSSVRNIDAKAIVDLAMYNYVEMRERVNSKKFLLRKKLDNFLNLLFPRSWIPLYTTVSFTRLRYHECINNRKWQDKILTRVLTFTGVAAVVGLSTAAWQFNHNSVLSFNAMTDMLTKTSLYIAVADFLHKLGF